MPDYLHDLPANEWAPPGVDVVCIETRPTVQTWLPGSQQFLRVLRDARDVFAADRVTERPPEGA